jgi:pimeloyl-ACP methyl ester carboxylesterase
MSTQTIARMAVEIAGDGEPVLTIHGLGGTSNTFEPQMAVLAGRYRVLRPDLPGAGRSVVPGSVSIGALVAAMAELCAVTGVRGAHVIGHSLGSIVAQHLAVEHPSLVRSLVLLGGIVEPPEVARTNLRARAEAVRARGMDEAAEAVVTGSLSADTRARNLAAVAFVRESMFRQNPQGYALLCETIADARAADAQHIRVPTLLLTGEDDPVAPPAMARLLSERIAGAQLHLLPRCGHWPGIERAEEVNRQLLAHLQRAR